MVPHPIIRTITSQHKNIRIKDAEPNTKPTNHLSSTPSGLSSQVVAIRPSTPATATSGDTVMEDAIFDIVHLDLPGPPGYPRGPERLQYKSQYIRREKLESMMNCVPGHFELVPASEATGLAEIRDEFDDRVVMVEGGEGLILKHPYAQYLPAQRPRHTYT